MIYISFVKRSSIDIGSSSVRKRKEKKPEKVDAPALTITGDDGTDSSHAFFITDSRLTSQALLGKRRPKSEVSARYELFRSTLNSS